LVDNTIVLAAGIEWVSHQVGKKQTQ